MALVGQEVQLVAALEGQPVQVVCPQLQEAVAEYWPQAQPELRAVLSVPVALQPEEPSVQVPLVVWLLAARRQVSQKQVLGWQVLYLQQVVPL